MVGAGGVMGPEVAWGSVKAQGPLRCNLHKVVVTSNDD